MNNRIIIPAKKIISFLQGKDGGMHLIITMGISMAVFITSVQLMQEASHMKKIQLLQSRAAFISDVEQAIRSITVDSASCYDILGDQSIVGPIDFGQAADVPSTSILKKLKTNPGVNLVNGLAINSITVKDIVNLASDPTGVSGWRTGTLYLDFEPIDGQTGRGFSRDLQFPMVFRVGPSQKILSCYGADYEEMVKRCQILGGTFDTVRMPKQCDMCSAMGGYWKNMGVNWACSIYTL